MKIKPVKMKFLQSTGVTCEIAAQQVGFFLNFQTHNNLKK